MLVRWSRCFGDYEWEESCLLRLMEAGAIPVEELESHWPSERMNGP